VRHEVVHNRFVVDNLQRGAIFVEELDEVPDGNTVIFSAHGVAQAVRRGRPARPEGVRCDLSAGHQGASGSGSGAPLPAGRDVVLIGHRPSGSRGHDGAVDPRSRCRPIHLVEDAEQVPPAINQPENSPTPPRPRCRWTTRAASSRRCAAFPAAGPKNDDICYATQNRQDAVRDLASVRPGAGGRLAEQLQLQPLARAGPS
jgi:4-hydroxy-3-methylbut-2-enyl diphosphate reductase